MPERFEAAVEYVSSGTVVRLAGTIDEEKDLGELTRQIPAGRVFVDLGEITRMNSLGLRKWIYWIQEIEARGADPVLVRCSRPVVLQLNQIHNFAGARGVVASFQLPYFCTRCQREQSLVVAPSDLNGPPWQPPDCRCENCDHLMEFDDVPDAYLEFLGRVDTSAGMSNPRMSAAGVAPYAGRAASPRLGGPADPTGPTKVLPGGEPVGLGMAAGTPARAGAPRVDVAYGDAIPTMPGKTPPPGRDRTPPPGQERTPSAAREKTPPPARDRTPPPAREKTPPPAASPREEANSAWPRLATPVPAEAFVRTASSPDRSAAPGIRAWVIVLVALAVIAIGVGAWALFAP